MRGTLSIHHAVTTSLRNPPRARFATQCVAVRPSISQVSAALKPDVGRSHWVQWSFRTQTSRHMSSLDPSRPPATNVVDELDFMQDDVGEDDEEIPSSAIRPEEMSSLTDTPKPSSSNRPRLPTSQKKLNKLLSRHVVHDIPEDEIEEQFITGRGPGGQAINRTNSAVSLLHRPTGIRIRAQPTRLRGKNREAARKLLREKLDDLRAKGLYPVPGDHDRSTEETVIDVMEVEEKDVQGRESLTKAERRAQRKEEEKGTALAYSQAELRIAKIRARKASAARKSRKNARRKHPSGQTGPDADEAQ